MDRPVANMQNPNHSQAAPLNSCVQTYHGNTVRIRPVLATNMITAGQFQAGRSKDISGARASSLIAARGRLMKARDSRTAALHKRRSKKTPAEPGFLKRDPARSERLDRGGLHALGAALGDKLHALAFLQGLESGALDFLEVGEEVFTAVGRGDEAETFGFVEPLHGAG